MNSRIAVRLLLFGLLALPLAAGCAPEPRYPAEDGSSSSGGWLWSILIGVITFIIGFLVGATLSRNGGIHLTHHRHGHHRRTEAGWNRIAQRIKDGTNQGLTEWRGAGRSEDADWDDLSRRIEERILEEMHKHHD
jgi:hypothetical protein